MGFPVDSGGPVVAGDAGCAGVRPPGVRFTPAGIASPHSSEWFPVTLCSYCRVGILCDDGDRLICRNGGDGYGDSFIYGNCFHR